LLDYGYLLLVEDEPVVQANNKMILERRGYKLRQAYTLLEARAMIAQELPRAIILDIQLPDGNGLDLLKDIREGRMNAIDNGQASIDNGQLTMDNDGDQHHEDAQLSTVNHKLTSIPVLVLTAMGTPKDIIKGLEAGGDDYLTKPHDLPTFLKRVDNLLRRAALLSG